MRRKYGSLMNSLHQCLFGFYWDRPLLVAQALLQAKKKPFEAEVLQMAFESWSLQRKIAVSINVSNQSSTKARASELRARW
jgi:hypothetical protein